ncbi:NAD(P)-dependent oxidoreductase [Dactylosporangium sp. CA-233914]|uniref:NAD(P)-dependent oxidoreductase n=1 Tax=Dactylosporangium sp. CA-233914 TaxID=3239934 RepID=UPI003D8D4277
MTDPRAAAAPSRITVFGATGRTGHALLERAGEAGLAVTAHGRNPGRLSGSPAERIVGGSILDPASVHDALTGADAAILAVGLGRDRQAPVFTTGTTITIEAMRAQHVRRLIVLSEAVYPPHTAGLVPRITAAAYRTVAAAAIRQRRLQDRLLASSGLDWTVVRPARVVEAPARGLRPNLDVPPRSLTTTTYADLARLILDIVAEPRTFGGNLYP